MTDKRAGYYVEDNWIMFRHAPDHGPVHTIAAVAPGNDPNDIAMLLNIGRRNLYAPDNEPGAMGVTMADVERGAAALRHAVTGQSVADIRQYLTQLFGYLVRLSHEADRDSTNIPAPPWMP